MKAPKLVALLLTALPLTACDGDEGPTGVITGNLAGVWTATVYEFKDNDTGQRAVDLIARDGATFTLTIDSSQDPPVLTASFHPGSGPGASWTDGGWVSIPDTELTIGAGVFTIVQDGNRMTLTNPDAVFAFEPGLTLASTLRIELDRL